MRIRDTNKNTPDRYDYLYTSEYIVNFGIPNVLGNLLELLFTGGRVLDVGFGVGNTFPFYKNVPKVYGIDFSPKGLEMAQEKRPDAILTLANFEGKPLPYNDNFFDNLFCGEVLEHMENPESLLKECKRVMADNAVGIFTTPYQHEIPSEEHLHEFNLEEITKLFSIFSEVSILRYCVDPVERWEHYCIIFKK
jgi:ubiquinone/menaquinone biosynthesis C-methylase UbiE